MPDRERSARAAFVVFALEEVVALPVLLYLTRDRWFNGDDWFFFFIPRSAFFDPNTWGHWITLPILGYRTLWMTVGMREYWPYLLLVMIPHLAIAALLRAVMRRSGAGPWVSTIAASMLLFFGSGAPGIVMPIQSTFNLALAFGLAHLLLADHDGGVDIRDYLGLAFGFAGLMCSNIAIAMVAAVGLAVLVRRGWRVALLHTAPLAAIYLAWWLTFARSKNSLLTHGASPPDDLRFVWNGITATFERLARNEGIGLLLIMLVIIGLVFAWQQAGADARKQLAEPLALLAGAVLFIASAGLIRASASLTSADNLDHYLPRYAYISAALVLPALAVASSAMIRRSHFVAPIVIVLLLVGLPGNYQRLRDFSAHFPPRQAHNMGVLAHVATQLDLPPQTRVPLDGPVPFGSADPQQYFTASWLINSSKSGRIPTPGFITPRERANATLHLLLTADDLSQPRACRPLRRPIAIVRTGDQIIARRGKFDIVLKQRDATSLPWPITAPRTLQAVGGPSPMVLQFTPAHRADPPTVLLCSSGR
jgi:hypothetical protein